MDTLTLAQVLTDAREFIKKQTYDDFNSVDKAKLIEAKKILLEYLETKNFKNFLHNEGIEYEDFFGSK